MKVVVINILLASTAVTDLVGTRIYPSTQPEENTTFPAIIVSQRGLDPEPTKDKSSVLDVYDIELTILGETSVDVTAITEACRSALVRYTGEVSGKKVQTIEFINEIDDFRDDLPIWGMTQLYEVKIHTEGNGPNFPPGISDPVTILAPDGSTAALINPGSSFQQAYINLRLLPSGTQHSQIAPPTDGQADTVDIPSVRVVLSNDDLLAEADAGDEVDVPDARVLNHRSEAVGDMVPGTINTLSAGLIKKSDGSAIIHSVAPGDDINLLATKVLDSEGATVATLHPVEGEETYTCPPSLTQSGVLYNSCHDFQKTSYHTGDEGWYNQNGDGVTIPAIPEKIMMIDKSQAEPFDFVTPNNVFDNNARFVHTDGTAAARLVVPADSMVLDCLTGWRWWVVRQSSMTLADAIAFAEASSLGGITSWRIPTKAMIQQLWNHERSYQDEPPGFGNLSLANIWTATTYELGSTSAYSTFTGGNFRMAVTSKTSTRNFIMCAPWHAQS
ncbi:tail completion protein gp17 [Sanyastnella coralliicola]|uniref:tail completion protein gp17 n=1 Tax=Sanyastnella coralliicola TaxID=3069118 RepID=UPI0027BA783D|nr:DUF3168 domain-containing protein [Longitalea sp. SCSIO 12813]